MGIRIFLSFLSSLTRFYKESIRNQRGRLIGQALNDQNAAIILKMYKKTSEINN